MKKRNSRIALLLALIMFAWLLAGCGATTYTVTFDPNGGELVSGQLTQKVPEGGDAEPPEVENGDMQLRWSGNYTNVTSDSVVTAKWINPKHTVTFDLNGGTLISGELTQEVEDGKAAEAPEAENGNLELSWDKDFSDVTEDLTVTAQWNKPHYTVTFDLNGGTLISGELTQSVEEGSAAAEPKAENGKLLLSWDKDFSSVTEDLTVTARWTRPAMDSTELAAYARPRTVTVTVETVNGGTSTGSGFFIDDQGTIITNYHVIDLGASMSVEVTGGGKYDVQRVVDFSPTYDLAVLQIDVSGNEYFDISDTPVDTGNQVFAVGSALGILDGTFTQGIISSVKRNVGLIECIQTDAAISSGNSGGPLVNVYGEVVGVNAFSYVDGQNLNLAIKMDMLDHLTMDKNWSVNEFKEWYLKESDRSFSPFDGSDYYYSLVNTYQYVTGASCLYSHTGNDTASGYYDCCEYYEYNYKESEYDAYVSYLKSIGFVFDSTEGFNEGTSYYYYNEKDNILVDLFILNDKSELFIWVKRT